jgi:hypothetical protein
MTDETINEMPEEFRLYPDFLGAAEEVALAEFIRTLGFDEVHMRGVTAKRRVAQFGWRYSFESYRLTCDPLFSATQSRAERASPRPRQGLARRPRADRRPASFNLAARLLSNYPICVLLVSTRNGQYRVESEHYSQRSFDSQSPV